MHLRSITLKGFKSFPNRTRLEFAPGIAVIIGPNGSGKSNITDAVLWALGEQSPLAVRGQSMQDVIFAGGHGVPSRKAAEVEVVIDNPHGVLDGEFSELSIVRRLDRSGDGEYRLNGARCRLVDVLEVLSDTGLGKEMHSVVSQGRVEAIIHSKPRDRRLLIEEAAGLGKHRKRRRRAQLKLERTQDNIARVLDVEREARSRLRPLKRQAEAAELHERLARQREALEAEEREAPQEAPVADRIAALTDELSSLDAEQAGAAEREVAGLVVERDAAAGRLEELEAAVGARRAELDAAEQAADAARRARFEAEREVESARHRAAEAGAELAAVNQFLARASRAPRGGRPLVADLGVEPGCEAAVAAALGPLLRAAVAGSVAEAGELLDRVGRGRGRAPVLAGAPP